MLRAASRWVNERVDLAELRRTLLESQDAIKRALEAQAFDSAGTGSPRGA